MILQIGISKNYAPLISAFGKKSYSEEPRVKARKYVCALQGKWIIALAPIALFKGIKLSISAYASIQNSGGPNERLTMPGRFYPPSHYTVTDIGYPYGSRLKF